MRSPLTFPAAILIAACAAESGSESGPRNAGLATVFDSTGDTVRARADGGVPEPAVRHLVEEMRIAPAADDTSLFTEVFEFDVAPDGRMLVFDRPTSTAMLFGPDGKLVRRIGRQGAGPGEFNSNNGMVALADTGWSIWDSRNARINYLTASGDFRTSSLTPAGFSTSNGLITDRSGRLYLRRPVTEPREGEILGRMGLVRIAADGKLADSLVPPDIDVPRESYVAERNEKGNQSRSSTGPRHGAAYHWAWHPDGYFVVAHGGTYEITLVRPGARPLAIRRSAPAVPVSEEERNEEQEILVYQMRNTDPGWTFRGPALPESKAALAGLAITRDGRIWARVPLPSERIPDDELTPPRDPKQPVNHFRTPVAYEIFGSDGRFLGRIVFPKRTTLMEADGNTVWALQRDENDLPAVVRFRVDPGVVP